MDVRIGCCGFPVARATYQEEFGLVEIQQTFYQPPRPETAARWRAAAPPAFEFTLKAWQLITHPPTSPTYRRLARPVPPAEKELYGFFRPTAELFSAWEETASIARELSAGIVVFQCPASFTPVAEHLADMGRFFANTERYGLRFAWEPRGEWPAELIRELCAGLDLIHCVDPFVAEPLAGTPAYLRLHGKGGYGYRYTDKELAWLAEKVLALERPAYVLFNNVSMYADAQRFARLLAGR